MGAFVWEWADHAILTEKGLRYGGDFGEPEHAGHFCVDGLLTTDRKLKSGALEMKAVYGGKLSSPMHKVSPLPDPALGAKTLSIEVDEHPVHAAGLGLVLGAEGIHQEPLALLVFIAISGRHTAAIGTQEIGVHKGADHPCHLRLFSG